MLLSYYGYQYSGHQTQEYRAATQALIWETILGGNTKVTYSTARYGQGTVLGIYMSVNCNSGNCERYKKMVGINTN